MRQGSSYATKVQQIGWDRVTMVAKVVIERKGLMSYDDVCRAMVVLSQILEGSTASMKIAKHFGVAKQTRHDWLSRDLPKWVDRMSVQLGWGRAGGARSGQAKGWYTEDEWDRIAEIKIDRQNLTLVELVRLVNNDPFFKGNLRSVHVSTLSRRRKKLEAKVAEVLARRNGLIAPRPTAPVALPVPVEPAVAPSSAIASGPAAEAGRPDATPGPKRRRRRGMVQAILEMADKWERAAGARTHLVELPAVDETRRPEAPTPKPEAVAVEQLALPMPITDAPKQVDPTELPRPAMLPRARKRTAHSIRPGQLEMDGP